MAVAMVQESDVITPEMYDAVNEKLNAYDTPPEGMIVHTAAFVDGKSRMFDVWESVEALERFREERLVPAIREVVGEDAPEAPPTEIYELHDLIKP